MLQSHLNNYSFGPARRRSRRGGGKPEQLRNIPSAFFSLVAAGLYAVSMAEPNWLTLETGTCSGQHIGLYRVFGSVGKSNEDIDTLYCMNDHAVLKLRIVAACCLAAVLTCLIQFGLDTCGTKRKGLYFLRKNSIFNIFGILLTVCVMTLVYWVMHDIRSTDEKTTVRFSFAFYLLIGSGCVTLFATILNLLRCTCERRSQPVDDDMAMELMYNEVLPNEPLPPIPPPVYQP